MLCWRVGNLHVKTQPVDLAWRLLFDPCCRTQGAGTTPILVAACAKRMSVKGREEGICTNLMVATMSGMAALTPVVKLVGGTVGLACAMT